MKLMLKWLEKKEACQSVIDWYKQQGTDDFLELCKRALDAVRFDDFLWCFSRRVDRKTRVLWACYATELVLSDFEKLYPDDKRPRLAIAAARKCALENTKNNRTADAGDAAYAAYVADAGNAGNAGADAASAAAAYAVYVADDAARKDMQIKIMDYGIKLLEEKCKKS